MRNRWLISFIFFLLAVSTVAQTSSVKFHSLFEENAFQSADPFRILLAADPEIDSAKYKKYRNELGALFARMLRKAPPTPSLHSLSQLFYQTHRRQLQWFEQYSIFSEIFESGKYDCVTGTALFAVLLDSLQLPYDIYEFDFHVFVIAQVGEQRILFESTDPLYGFVSDPGEIEDRIAFYQQEAQKIQGSYLTNRISLRELAGLHYMNLGIRYFNEGHTLAAAEYVQKAKFLYPSPRIKELLLLFDRQIQLASN